MNHLEWLAWALAFAVLQVADAATTLTGLSLGRVELNPLASSLFMSAGNWAIWPLKLAGLCAVLLISRRLCGFGHKARLIWVFPAFFVAVVANNVYLLS